MTRPPPWAPPEWRPLLCAGAPGAGVADAVPAPAPPALTAEAVRYGIAARAPVPTESGSMGDILFERLASGGGAALLGALVDAVRDEQAAAGARLIAAPAPCAPALRGGDDAGWATAIADPHTPLTHLHVPRVPPARLLALVAHAPLERAVWALRTAAPAALTPAVLAWLTHLLATRAPLLAHACALVQELRAAGLVGEYAYLRWVATQTAHAPAAVLPCVLQLAAAAAPRIARHAALALALVDALHRDLSDMPSRAWLAREMHAVRACVLAHNAGAAANPRVPPDAQLPARTAARRETLRSGLAQFIDAASTWPAALDAAFDSGRGVPRLPQHAAALLAWAVRDADRTCAAGALAAAGGLTHDAVVAWIDSLTDVPPGAPAVLGELERRGIFVYARFMQRVIARGELRPEAPARGGVAARLFRTMPLHAASEVQLQQRRCAIYGARATESHEEASFRRAAREIRAALAARPVHPLALTALPHVHSASQYTRHRLAVEVVLAADVVQCASEDTAAALCALLVEMRELPALHALLGTLDCERVVSSMRRAHARGLGALGAPPPDARLADAPPTWAQALSACMHGSGPCASLSGVQLTACTIDWVHHAVLRTHASSCAWTAPVLDGVLRGTIDARALIARVLVPFMCAHAGAAHPFWRACELLCTALLNPAAPASPTDFCLAQLHPLHWHTDGLAGAVDALLTHAPTFPLVCPLPPAARDAWRTNPGLLGARPSARLLALLDAPPAALWGPHGAAAVLTTHAHLAALHGHELTRAADALVAPLFCAHPHFECAGDRLMALAPAPHIVRALASAVVARATQRDGDICCIRLAAACPTYVVPCGESARAALALVRDVETPRAAAFLLALLRMQPLAATRAPGRELIPAMASLVATARRASGAVGVALGDAAAMVQYAMDGDALEGWLRAQPASTDPLRAYAPAERWMHAGPPAARHDALETHRADSRDPLQYTLSNTSSIPLGAFGMRKTRESVRGGLAAPAFLATEHSYSDDATAPAAGMCSAKRRAHAAAPARKRARTGT